MKTIFAAATLALLIGCASGGPVPTGQDTYMLTKQSAGGVMVSGARVKADLLAEGNAFCARSSKTLQLLTSDSTNATPFAPIPSAEIHFKCAAN